MSRLRGAALALALFTTTSACGGPKVPLELFVKEDPIDIAFGDQNPRLPPPDRPAGAEVFNPGFPSFISPPPPKVAPSVLTGPGLIAQPGPSGPPAACPRPDAFATPEQFATDQALEPPREGYYQYRRTGTAKVGGRQVGLAPRVSRRITNVQQSQSGTVAVIRFDAVQQETNVVGARDAAVESLTTTSYQIDRDTTQVGADTDVSGLKIRSISTAGPNGTDFFAPQPPVRIMVFPARAEAADPPPPTSSTTVTTPPSKPGHDERGVDPLTGYAMEIHTQTLDRAEVEGCGVVYQAWRQHVQGTYHLANGNTLYFSSVLYVVPQYGGLIIRDVVHVSDQAPRDDEALHWELPDGTAIDLKSDTVINSIVPSERP